MKANEIIQLALKGWKLSDIKELAELEKSANDNEVSTPNETKVTSSEDADASDVSASNEETDGVDYKAKCAELESKLAKAQKANITSKNTSNDKSDDEILLELAKDF